MELPGSIETAERCRKLMTALACVAGLAAVMLFIGGLNPYFATLAKLAAWLWLLGLMGIIPAARFWAGLPLEQRYDDAPSEEVHKQLAVAWILVFVGVVSLLCTVYMFQNEIGLARMMFALLEMVALGLSGGALWWVLRDALNAE